jgi:hypothetical protein
MPRQEKKQIITTALAIDAAAAMGGFTWMFLDS